MAQARRAGVSQAAAARRVRAGHWRRCARGVYFAEDHPVGGYEVDVAFPASKIAIETDGWAFHNDQPAFQHDRERQNEIALLGWQVLRFTWLDLVEYPQRVISEIRFAISVR